MRHVARALVFLLGLSLQAIVPQARAAPSGFVESVGFENHFRPGCWTPMLVTLNPGELPSGTYQLRVSQEDMDGDLALFTQSIPLTAVADGGRRDQKFRMYFLPEPTHGGLPSANEGGRIQDLQARLRVSLHDDDGRHRLNLPITSTLLRVDRGLFNPQRGARLVLCVTDGTSRPIWQDSRLATQSAELLGVKEEIVAVNVQTAALPENPLGYEAVDAVVWFAADPADLRRDGGEKLQALKDYVRQGGHLVVVQNAQWQKNLVFADLLPVQLQGLRTGDDLSTLKQLLPASVAIHPDWVRMQGPFPIVQSTPRTGAIVELVVDEPTAGGFPFLARHRWGAGGVTWIAQDLGDPALSSRVRLGWESIWTTVLGLGDRPILAGESTPQALKRRYAPADGLELGAGLLQLDVRGRSALLVGMALVFFIGYWAVAGPGLHFVLAARKLTHWSWFLFALCGLVATGVTVILVWAVLRGPPQMKHLTLYRQAAGEPTVIRARLGLYIPRDGPQRLGLEKNLPERRSWLSPLGLHPALVGVPSPYVGPDYAVPVGQATGEPVQLSVPYRSTLKKFQALWIGEAQATLLGQVQLDAAGLAGELTNQTGQDLINVYFAYPVQGEQGRRHEMIYLPRWKAGQTLPLRQALRMEEGRLPPRVGEKQAAPGINTRVWGRLDTDWFAYWVKDRLAQAPLFGYGDDSGALVPQTWPILSFYDLLPPMENPPAQEKFRSELRRTGAREYDVSAALRAGALVVLAEARDQPLPFAFEVQRETVTGTGNILYQFILPLDPAQDEGPPAS